MMNSIKKITKRDGRTVEFDVNKIAEAIFKAAQVLGGRDREMAMYLAKQTELYLLEVCHNQVPTVEQIQDAVEKDSYRKRTCSYSKRIHTLPCREDQSPRYEHQTHEDI